MLLFARLSTLPDAGAQVSLEPSTGHPYLRPQPSSGWFYNQPVLVAIQVHTVKRSTRRWTCVAAAISQNVFKAKKNPGALNKCT